MANLTSTEMEKLESELNGMHAIYRDIANEIGIEHAIIIYQHFRGTQVSFPSRLFTKEYIYQAIAKEYDGDNIHQLAQKYNYSERSIWRILKRQEK